MRGLKTKTGHKWKRPLISIILIGVLAVLANSLSKVYQKKRSAEDALARMQKEEKTLLEREKFLEESLSQLQTREGLEFEIRKKLNVAKVGERVAVVVTEDEAAGASPAEVSFWQKIKDFFTTLFE